MLSLKEKYKDYFQIGAAVNSDTVVKEGYIIKEHFDTITCENTMKFGEIYKDNGVYDFADPDIVYNFAKDNNLKMRGHNFVWHNQTPRHIFDKSAEEVREILKNHIITMHDRYGECTTCWDVLNECIEDKTDGYLRKSIWLDKFGEDYPKQVFAIARESLPKDVQLFYNDYNEYVPEKRDKIARLIRSINDEDKLVDGVGLQCHVNLYYPTLDLMKEAIELYASLGLRIHVTEMDLSHFKFDDKTVLDKPDPELTAKHAKLYGEYFALFREYKDYIDNVTLWGVSDRYTWLDYFPVKNRKNWPLLFDEEGNKKQAFYEVMDF